MNNSPDNLRSPSGLFRGEPTAKLCDRAMEVVRARQWCFLPVRTGKGFLEVILNKS